MPRGSNARAFFGRSHCDGPVSAVKRTGADRYPSELPLIALAPSSGLKPTRRLKCGTPPAFRPSPRRRNVIPAAIRLESKHSPVRRASRIAAGRRRRGLDPVSTTPSPRFARNSPCVARSARRSGLLKCTGMSLSRATWFAPVKVCERGSRVVGSAHLDVDHAVLLGAQLPRALRPDANRFSCHRILSDGQRIARRVMGGSTECDDPRVSRATKRDAGSEARFIAAPP